MRGIFSDESIYSLRRGGERVIAVIGLEWNRPHSPLTYIHFRSDTNLGGMKSTQKRITNRGGN